MKVALGAAVAVTGAGALIYILLRSRKRHPDPGKPDDATAIQSEKVSPSKLSEKEAKEILTEEISASCSDVSCESKDTEDAAINKCPYVNFNGHVPINGKNSEILDDVSVKECCDSEQHAEVGSENVAEVKVKELSVDASSRQYSKIENEDSVMSYSSVAPLELIEEKDGSIEPSVSQNLEGNENISVDLVIEEDIISNTTVPENLSSKPVTLGMEKYDYHTTTMLTKEEKEPMKGSDVHNLSIAKPALSTRGSNEESNVISDLQQDHELSTSLELQDKEPSGLPNQGKKQALTDLCDFVIKKDSLSFTSGRDQESVSLPSLDLNKEDIYLPDISQRDSLSVQNEKSTESLVLHKEGESHISSSLMDEKQPSVSSNFEQEEESSLSSNLATEEGSTLSLDIDHGEKANEHSHNFFCVDQGEQLGLFSSLDQLKQSTLSPILAKERRSAPSSMDQEEYNNLSSSVLKQESSATNFDQEEHQNLSSSTDITCNIGNDDQSNLSFCKYQEEKPASLSITSKEGSMLLDEEEQCSHSSCLNQAEQFSILSNSNTGEHSTILFNEEEHIICSSNKKQEEQPYLSSTFDQEKECALSFNLAQDEGTVNSTQEGFDHIVQQEESFLPKEEQSTLSTTLDQNQEDSNVLLMESDKFCVQDQEVSKDNFLESVKLKKNDCQENSQKDEEIKSTPSEYLAKEIVTINCNEGNIDLHQEASEQEKEEEMADGTQNTSSEDSIVRESSNIGTCELEELCSTTTEMLGGSSSTETPEWRHVHSTESGKVRESNCTSICMKESTLEIDNLKEGSNTGIDNLKESTSTEIDILKESSNTDIGNYKESNNADTSKLKESNDLGISKLSESSNTAPSKSRDSRIIGTYDIEENGTHKKTAVSDKDTLRKQFQENQRDSAAADLDHDSSEQENVNSDSLSVKSFDSSEIEPETLFKPSTFPVSNQEQYIFYEFEIPQTLVGRLIGRKGAFVSRVKATTYATVIVHPHKNRRLKLCSVEGTRQQVREALGMIREHFPENRYPDITLAQVSTQPTVLTPAQPTLNTQAMQIELTSGVVVEVRVSAVVSAGELWVQQPLHPSFSALHRLQSCMNLNYGDGSNTPPLPSPIQGGTVCVAQIKKHWLRCQVLSTENDVSLVVLLDVGGTVSIATSLLRQIRYDYMTLPFQATQCFLHGVQPTKDNVWDDVSLAVMEELVSDTILFATVVSYTEDGVPLVSLYRRDQDQYVHLNEKLVLLGHAQWVSPQPAS